MLLGLLIATDPSLAFSIFLTLGTIYIGLFVAALAIIFGLTHWLVAIYVKENLHIFGRFFVLGHSLIGLLEMYGWASGLIDFEPKYLFGTMFPFAAAFTLLMYSIKPDNSMSDQIRVKVQD